MGQIRVFFLVVMCISVIFIMWLQYDFKHTQETDILYLASAIKEIEAKIKVDIKDKLETNLDMDLGLYETQEHIDLTTNVLKKDNENNSTELKYILIWTTPNRDPLMYLLNEQEAFIKRKCKVTNCYITTNSSLRDITEFDVILFNGPEVIDKKNPKLPSRRLPRQNYVFASIESSGYYPTCNTRFNGYFNVSWTYKLNSDIFYGYIIVRDSKGEIVGPKEEMHWIGIHEMRPVNDTIKRKLSSKTKLAAWMVSNCRAPSGRDNFVRKVQQKLSSLGTDMMVDVYGYCGTIRCTRSENDDCLLNFENNYYFYFSFENSFTEDYVTEKVLHGLQHYTIPVVYGTANYSRFMPEGSYLNALDLGPEALAKKMLEIINDKELYYSYFKWLNHYSFHYVEETPETDFYCKFCEAMNDENLMNRVTIIENFYDWWNPSKIRPGPCRNGKPLLD